MSGAPVGLFAATHLGLRRLARRRAELSGRLCPGAMSSPRALRSAASFCLRRCSSRRRRSSAGRWLQSAAVFVFLSFLDGGEDVSAEASAEVRLAAVAVAAAAFVGSTGRGETSSRILLASCSTSSSTCFPRRSSFRFRVRFCFELSLSRTLQISWSLGTFPLSSSSSSFPSSVCSAAGETGFSGSFGGTEIGSETSSPFVFSGEAFEPEPESESSLASASLSLSWSLLLEESLLSLSPSLSLSLPLSPGFLVGFSLDSLASCALPKSSTAAGSVSVSSCVAAAAASAPAACVDAAFGSVEASDAFRSRCRLTIRRSLAFHSLGSFLSSSSTTGSDLFTVFGAAAEASAFFLVRLAKIFMTVTFSW
mmetsp:Transcript_30032/g.70801  ORF Transcript_30032/g.70801 Transcript_30032/m.70801 type:complete len:366 (-) Transcript_30032:110-1207(-)